MKTNLSLSKAPFGVIGIVGHAGCGHANSHLGFIQDDSGGLSAVLGLLRDATGLSLEIVECMLIQVLMVPIFMSKQSRAVKLKRAQDEASRQRKPAWLLIA